MAKRRERRRTGAQTRHSQRTGPVIAIGGHEDRSGSMPVLRNVAERADGLLLVATLASNHHGVSLWKDYRSAFGKIGLEVEHLDIERRDAAYEARVLELFERARGVFFTGGDQLRITSRFGGTSACEAMRAMHARGGVVAGTSAGAAVLADIMIFGDSSKTTPSAMEGFAMAPGLGLLKDVLIDQHFAERGRVGRLLRAVATNPRLLGIGIDEDTAVAFAPDGTCSVVGRGGVYVLDGRSLHHSNIGERTEAPLDAFGMRLDLLNASDHYDLERRTASHHVEGEENEEHRP